MPVDPQQAALEGQVGNPWERWRALINRVTGGAVQQFAAVEQEWLDLMWCLDAYRAAGVSPRRVGRRRDPSPEAANRGKGQWFKTLLIALLGERTPQRLATRTIVPGFSQAAGSTLPGQIAPRILSFAPSRGSPEPLPT